jgi:hypothetical protein
MNLFVELKETDVVAVNGRYFNGTWMWLRANYPFNLTAIGWRSLPPPENGDCIGLSKNATSAPVYSCIYPKRVMCSYT